MKHFATPRFWQCYEALTSPVRALADKNYALLKADPRHPSLHFKRVGDFWSVRVSEHHRALGIDVTDGISWFWIGAHDEYERLIG